MAHPKTILITAGPSREKLDPVRFITNHSTGYLGYEIAKEAKRRGYTVILLVGPVVLPVIAGIKTYSFESAKDLEKLLLREIKKADVLFMTSAVCDFFSKVFSGRKIKRAESLTLHLQKTRDILKHVSQPRIKKDKTFVGFCLETENLIRNAKKKLESKRLDYIVGTQASSKKLPFGKVPMDSVVLDQEGNRWIFPALSKDTLAKKIFQIVLPKTPKKTNRPLQKKTSCV